MPLVVSSTTVTLNQALAVLDSASFDNWIALSDGKFLDNCHCGGGSIVDAETEMGNLGRDRKEQPPRTGEDERHTTRTKAWWSLSLKTYFYFFFSRRDIRVWFYNLTYTKYVSRSWSRSRRCGNSKFGVSKYQFPTIIVDVICFFSKTNNDCARENLFAFQTT